MAGTFSGQALPWHAEKKGSGTFFPCQVA